MRFIFLNNIYYIKVKKVIQSNILEDDVLPVGPQLNEFVIIGHPDGEHIVEYIPLDVVPLAAVPGLIVMSDDEDDVHVIHVEHLDDDIDGRLRADVTNSSFATIPIATQSPVQTLAPTPAYTIVPATTSPVTPTPLPTPDTPTAGHPLSPICC
ncbi:hypothetical protein Hanom_Chr10g00893681 [Helianthus anomalus]